MKKLLSVLICWAFSQTAFAAGIAATPEQVQPLINGSKVPQVMLQDATGKTFDLAQKIQEKPTVLVFYRGGWCPYCNAQLAGLREIEPQLAQLGYQIIALSPELPEAVLKSQQNTKDAALNYQLLSDNKFAAAKAFGVAYYLDDATEKMYKGTYGIHLTYDSNGKAVLPVPAVYLMDTKGEVQFSFVHINYKTRLQPKMLLLAAELAQQAAAGK